MQFKKEEEEMRENKNVYTEKKKNTGMGDVNNNRNGKKNLYKEEE